MSSPEQRSPAVGFIGLGDQGAPMAQAIGDRGFDLHVWARRPTSLEAMAGIPHTAHATVVDLVAASDILALCLRDDGDIWDVLNTPGVREHLRPGTVVVNHGTGDPGENVTIAESLYGLDVFYLDAPVSGGGPGAQARTLTTFVGGDAVAFDRCTPVLATFSTRVSRMGPVGTGQMTKLLNNAMTMSNLKNAVDLVRLAQQLHVDIPALLDVIRDSSGGSASLRALGTVITPENALHLQGLMRKDIEHFADTVRAHGLDAEELRRRALAGADGLVDAVTLATSPAHPACPSP
ncbi:NAD(P)-dependent oxidoreductase [Streptomyces sp. NBC_01622]|uniref:NAD(P)-dependent oxidoreductase n=1 Tax=Streptomyces sp. NBC_01622 TaxID=2975903 RepID=UPI0038686FEB|nr:NAD(P)-dependent oxidoreductase [Streptomyces sp. NBC_01622]